MTRISLAAFFTYLSFIYAQPSGQSIILKMDQQLKPVDIEMDFKMTLISNSKKNKRKSHFRLMKQIEKRYQDGKFKSKLLLRFIEPKEVKGSSLLNWDRIGEKNDDQWLYIPKLRKVKRIRPSDKSRNFQGSEFTYGDFIERDIELDSYELIAQGSFSGNECYVVKATPNDGSNYQSRIFWIDK
ncbi:MAG: outer membrane lipoprotein-sorting protein, partial [Candidatus Neomarinimicrobiota bacterium]|nr:outer membrane lipoprotein-sorting protein [Candidatus Neomarinimicrobiota bacterium]